MPHFKEMVYVNGVAVQMSALLLKQDLAEGEEAPAERKPLPPALTLAATPIPDTGTGLTGGANAATVAALRVLKSNEVLLADKVNAVIAALDALGVQV
jgi:hypothetical protein